MTTAQQKFLDETPQQVETDPQNPNRIRLVYPTLGQTSRWFSKLWSKPLWLHVRPLSFRTTAAVTAA